MTEKNSNRDSVSWYFLGLFCYTKLQIYKAKTVKPAVQVTSRPAVKQAKRLENIAVGQHVGPARCKSIPIKSGLHLPSRGVKFFGSASIQP